MENNYQRIGIDVIDDPVLSMRSDIDDDSIDELARSIKQHGLINPISVRRVGARYEVIAGHRRLFASRRAGLILIPCVVQSLSDAETLVVRAHENFVRRDTDPVEDSIFFGRLISEKGYTRERILKEFDLGQTFLDNRLALLDYPDYMLARIAAGEIGLGVARWLMKIEDEVQRINWLEPAARDGINESTAERWYNQWKLNVLPVVATPEAVEVASGGQAPPEAAIQCARCLLSGLVKDMTTVWIHCECPLSFDSSGT